MAKSINLYLIDGDTSDRIKAQLGNWNGIIYRIPRQSLDKCSTGGDIAKHIQHAGIYFLLGETEDGNPSIYIGQASARKNGKGLIQRITEHKGDANEWNEIVILTRKEDSLDATELNCLENKFTNLAINARRYTVVNRVDPSKGNISEEKEYEMDEYIANSLIIVSVLGIKAFDKLEPKPSRNADNSSEGTSKTFQYQGRQNATLAITNEGFVLLEGSQISPKLAAHVPEATKKLRAKYAGQTGPDYTTTENLLFGSSSAAAAFVGGFSASGNEYWKNPDGLSPKDI